MVLLGGPLGISLAPQIKAYSGGLYKALKPLANAYANVVGHRKMGLKYDDLITEEREDIQRALGRLTTREEYDRSFRMRQAFQQSVMHKPLPKAQWLKPSEDDRYLTPRINQVVKEDDERTLYDTMSVEKRK
ncbi:Cytochrome b-c1 complex subunit 7 [Saitozyma podzolica]|uniref:Complex III subunit 7 n=1 Tax=Saitozyma podzolica TaxID=1890683 RepID=A0A427YVS7_9TREE|nr:Cytochrome b-c1 complex subunit 7 [Saitozyma podzolica]